MIIQLDVYIAQLRHHYKFSALAVLIIQLDVYIAQLRHHYKFSALAVLIIQLDVYIAQLRHHYKFSALAVLIIQLDGEKICDVERSILYLTDILLNATLSIPRVRFYEKVMTYAVIVFL